MKLHCERLDDRLNPVLFNQTLYPGLQAIPGFAGPEVEAEGSFYAGHATCQAFMPAAGSGGAARLVIRDGGLLNTPMVPTGQTVDGVPILQAPDAGQILFDEYIYDPSFRGGADITSVENPDGTASLVIVPGPGGGGQVVVFDPSTGAQHSFLALGDPNYRGGLSIESGPESLPAGKGTPQVLAIMPAANGGGAPVVGIYTPDGTQLAKFPVGPADFRQGDGGENYELDPDGFPVVSPSTQALPPAQQVYVFHVFGPGGESDLWTFGGVHTD